MKFRKKPVVIDAIRLPICDPTDDVVAAVHAFFGEFTDWGSDYDAGIFIKTLEGTMRVSPGDWVIRGVKGEFYPCKPEIFEATYEKVEE